MSSSGHRHHLAAQARKAMNDAKLTLMMAQFCAAIEIECEAISYPGVTDLGLPFRVPDVFTEN
jgi:hypothetical protein